MRLRSSISGRVRPSVRPSVGPSVGPSRVIFDKAIFEGKKSSNVITRNDTMSDDEVVASDVPPRYLLFSDVF